MSPEIASQLIRAINRVETALKVQSAFIAVIMVGVVAAAAAYWVWRLREG